MQISFGGIQIHLRSAAGRLPGTYSVAPTLMLMRIESHPGPEPQKGRSRRVQHPEPQKDWLQGCSTLKSPTQLWREETQLLVSEELIRNVFIFFLCRISVNVTNCVRWPFDLPLEVGVKERKTKHWKLWKLSGTLDGNRGTKAQQCVAARVALCQDVLTWQDSSFTFPVTGKTICSTIMLWSIKKGLSKIERRRDRSNKQQARQSQGGQDQAGRGQSCRGAPEMGRRISLCTQALAVMHFWCTFPTQWASFSCLLPSLFMPALFSQCHHSYLAELSGKNFSDFLAG